MKVFIRYDKHDTWREVKQDDVGRKTITGKMNGIAVLFDILDIDHLEIRVESD